MTDTVKVGPLRVRPHTRNGQPSGSWEIDIPPRYASDGRRRRPLFETKREAIEEARRKLREIQLRGAVTGTAPIRSGFTLSEIAKEWTAEEEARVRTLKKRASSLATDLQRMNAVLTFLGADDIANINERRLVEYQERRLGMDRKPNTINGELRHHGMGQKTGLDPRSSRY